MVCAAFLSTNHILKSISIYDLLQGGMWCVIVASILWSVKKGKKHTSKMTGLPVPGLRYRTFSIFGSLNTLPSTSSLKRLSLPVTAFIMQTVLGHCKLFEKDPLFYFDAGSRRLICLAKPEAVQELLKSNNILRKGWVYNLMTPWLGTGLLTSAGTKWRSRRKLLTSSFHFDILKDFLPIIDQQSRTLIDILKGKVNEEFVDVVNPITLCSLDIICETTLGIHIGAQRNCESEYVQAVLRASRVIMDRTCNPKLLLEPVFRVSAQGRQFKKDVNTLHNFTRKVIQQRKAALIACFCGEEESSDVAFSYERKRKALMDRLIGYQIEHQDITEEGIREEIDTFAFAGHDTTSMGMSWALYLIGLHPEVQEKLHEELNNIFGDDVERSVTMEDLRDMRYLECVLKESQRLYPSVPMFGREAEEDMLFCGFRIRKGNMFIVLSYALHRNPETFPDPEKFDPDRFLPENCIGRHPFAYVPFCAGPRNCIGQRLAMMEEKAVIANILRNFHVKSLDQRDRIILSTELLLRPGCPLRLKFRPRAAVTDAAS